MLCYQCARRDVEQPAVALCRSCSVGLCLDHLREATAWFAANPIAACHHDTWTTARQPRTQRPGAESAPTLVQG
jgi:hypothetical protein